LGHDRLDEIKPSSAGLVGWDYECHFASNSLL